MTIAELGLRPIASSIKNIVLTVFTLSICAAMIAVPNSSARGVSGGIAYCINILVPSLFPFMFMASFIVKSRIFENLQKAFSPLTKLMFYLPGCTAPTIFLSLIGGYPVGARGVKSLLENKEINSEQASRMMCFCVNAGPAFILGVVGSALLKNPFMGMIIFAVQVVVSLLIGVLCGIIVRYKKTAFYLKKESVAENHTKISEAIVKSCEEASRSMLVMCTLVIVFSALLSMFKDFDALNFFTNFLFKFGIPRSESLALLTSFLEITAGCAQAAHLHSAPATIAFAIGYGGVCVHLQVASILTKTDFNYRKFCIFRFFNALMSGILTHVAVSVFEKSTPVFSTISQPAFVSNSSTAHGSAALIALCFYFIFTVNKNGKNNSRNKRLIKSARIKINSGL